MILSKLKDLWCSLGHGGQQILIAALLASAVAALFSVVVAAVILLAGVNIVLAIRYFKIKPAGKQVETPIKIHIGALIAGAVGTLTLYGFPVVIGLTIYYSRKGKKPVASSLAMGMGLALLIAGVTCFVILGNAGYL